MWVVEIDKNGLYIPGSDNPEYSGKESPTIVATPIPTDKSFWHPRWAGIWDGEKWISGEWVEGHENIPSKSLSDLKVLLIEQIVSFTASKQEELIAGYSAAERDTWDKKAALAKAFLQSKNLVDAGDLVIEASAAKGAASESEIMAATTILAQKVLAKADYLYKTSFKLSGIRSFKIDRVKELSSVEELESFDYTSGWE